MEDKPSLEVNLYFLIKLIFSQRSNRFAVKRRYLYVSRAHEADYCGQKQPTRIGMSSVNSLIHEKTQMRSYGLTSKCPGALGLLYNYFVEELQIFPSKEEAKLSLEVNLSCFNQTNISSTKQPVCCERLYLCIKRAHEADYRDQKDPTRIGISSANSLIHGNTRMRLLRVNVQMPEDALGLL
ncbi:hypothetical protein CEXT_636451 [Caerostris extrusa]|uniref:Uncharacterized protein n=1 Tax=Caerostris extrusa TaxID=172846 RepID=A0AAV4XD04_CAEEX|nr:hypothetical protein CEXT_636451 [Caerostris extrusa]